GMEEGTLLRWLKSVGDQVDAGDPIAEIETDKVALEIEAAESGYLIQTLVDEGQTVPIGTAIAQIGAEGEAPTADAPAADTPPAEAPAAEVAAEPEAPVAEPVAASAPAAAPAATPAPAAPVRAEGEKLRASPLVKRLAAEHDIDLSGIPGTGPGGRIVKDDLAPYLTGARPKPAPAAAPAETAPPAAPAPLAASADGGARPAGVPREQSRIRKTTAKRMVEAKQVIPHFYVVSEVDMTEARAFREMINGEIEEKGSKVSFNDLVVKAAALALRDYPNLNASLEGDQLYDHQNIDINIAVAIENGLIAPFLPDTDKLSLGTIARMTKDLAGRAREGGLLPEEYQGGTFTISNLGMYDVSEFVAIINPPQAAILAIGSIAEVPVFKDGEVVPAYKMKITLSADHRISDGAEAALFLQTVKGYLEKPLRLVL
ncbi:MAG: 2-oxo acid dehydrogenase subunit E2, partial [Thermomicrobiales bacterium]|nr:2-oxo acid dehydrogenase subunit E2 [Thermomicrobiales bacterium]